MLNQNLNIALLELFDELALESIFIKYQELEQALLEEKEVVNKIQSINEMYLELAKIAYEPFQTQLSQKISTMEDDLNNNQLYQEYLKYYQLCNTRLNEISKLIFKDIINVSEMINDES